MRRRRHAAKGAVVEATDGSSGAQAIFDFLCREEAGLSVKNVSFTPSTGRARPAKSPSSWRARRASSPMRSGGKAYAVVIGAGGGAAGRAAQELSARRRSMSTKTPTSTAFLLDPIVDYLEAAARAVGPSLVLIPNTLSGRDVAGRLMVRLGCRHRRRRRRDSSPKMARRSAFRRSSAARSITHCALRPAEYGVVTVRPMPLPRSPAAPARRSTQLAKPAAKPIAPRSNATSKKAPASSRSRRHPSSSQAAEGSAGRNHSRRC